MKEKVKQSRREKSQYNMLHMLLALHDATQSVPNTVVLTKFIKDYTVSGSTPTVLTRAGIVKKTDKGVLWNTPVRPNLLMANKILDELSLMVKEYTEKRKANKEKNAAPKKEVVDNIPIQEEDRKPEAEPVTTKVKAKMTKPKKLKKEAVVEKEDVTYEEVVRHLPVVVHTNQVPAKKTMEYRKIVILWGLFKIETKTSVK